MHKHRIFIIAASAVAILGSFLPWPQLQLEHWVA